MMANVLNEMDKIIELTQLIRNGIGTGNLFYWGIKNRLHNKVRDGISIDVMAKVESEVEIEIIYKLGNMWWDYIEDEIY